MKSKSSSKRCGHALLLVLIFSAALLSIFASMLSLSVFEYKMERRSTAILELKNTTDTLLNYGASQVISKAPFCPYPAVDLTVSKPDSTLFSEESNRLSLGPLGAEAPFDNEVIVSKMTRLTNLQNIPVKFSLNARAPINYNDPLSSQKVFRDLVMVACKAAVKNPSSPQTPINEYGVLVLERRLLTVFDYLAFLDVALFRINIPGSNIVLDGPIQANQGIAFYSTSSITSTVQILDKLSTPGTFTFVGSTKAGMFAITNGGTTTSSNGGISGMPALTPVSTGRYPSMVDMINVKKGTSLYETSDDYAVTGGTTFSDGTYITNPSQTSTVVDKALPFYNFMKGTSAGATSGYLTTGETGAQSVPIDGLTYVSDPNDPSLKTSTNWDTDRLIDPPNPANYDASGVAKTVTESAKTATQASLYMYVDSNGAVKAFVAAGGRLAYQNAMAYKSSGATVGLLSASVVGSFVKTPSVTRYQDTTTNASGVTTVTSKVDLPSNAIYDNQQKATVGLVDLNVGALGAVLKSGAVSLASGGNWTPTATGTGWNGVIYVEVQSPSVALKKLPVTSPAGVPIDAGNGLPNASTTNPLYAALPTMNVTKSAMDWSTDATLPSSSNANVLTGLRLQNARSVPGGLVGGNTGFTLATNTATYSVGSINADGDLTTGTTSLQDGQTSSSAAIPSTVISCGIFSDKNVVLSENFAAPGGDYNLYVKKPSSQGALPKALYNNWSSVFTGAAASGTRALLGDYEYQSTSVASGVNSYTGKPYTRNIELSTAFLVGDDANSNKGIHTMLSFLESFNPTGTSSDVLRMRGSIVGVYHPKYFIGKAGYFNDYYVAPTRTYGYSTLLRAGQVPPGSPTISSIRRMRQFTISEGDYQALKKSDGTIDSWISILGSKY